MHNKFWDEIDYFLYYDFWHREGHEKSKEIRKNNLGILRNKLENDFEIFLGKKTVFNLLSSEDYDYSYDAEYLICTNQNKQKLKNIIEKSDFQIVFENKKQLNLLRQNRLIVIHFKSKIIFSGFKIISLLESDFKIFKSYIYFFKLTNKTIKIFNKFKNKFKLFKLKINNNYNKNILLKNLKLDIYEVGSIHEINLKTFLNLEIESKKSPSWIVRKPHLDLVTANKKYTKIGEIINYLNKNKLEELIKKVQESKIETNIDGSISHSKKFWHSGNNYFIYAIYYQFKKNVIPYKDINRFLENEEHYIYSKDYYESLDSMNDMEIIDFLSNNPIEITNNCITSGKHRAFAMIGRIIDEKDYIPFMAKFG